MFSEVDEMNNEGDLVDKFYSILSCNTCKSAREIIDDIPEDKLMHLVLFLFMQYRNLLQEEYSN